MQQFVRSFAVGVALGFLACSSSDDGGTNAGGTAGIAGSTNIAGAGGVGGTGGSSGNGDTGAGTGGSAGTGGMPVVDGASDSAGDPDASVPSDVPSAQTVTFAIRNASACRTWYVTMSGQGCFPFGIERRTADGWQHLVLAYGEVCFSPIASDMPEGVPTSSLAPAAPGESVVMRWDAREIVLSRRQCPAGMDYPDYLDASRIPVVSGEYRVTFGIAPDDRSRFVGYGVQTWGEPPTCADLCHMPTVTQTFTLPPTGDIEVDVPIQPDQACGLIDAAADGGCCPSLSADSGAEAETPL
jgi:hypothetical protein